MQICETKDLSYTISSHFEQCHAAECQQYCICQTTRLKLEFVACHMNIQKDRKHYFVSVRERKVTFVTALCSTHFIIKYKVNNINLNS